MRSHISRGLLSGSPCPPYDPREGPGSFTSAKEGFVRRALLLLLCGGGARSSLEFSGLGD